MAVGIIIPKVSDTNIIIPNETYYEFLTSGTWICKKTGTYKIELIGGGASGYSGRSGYLTYAYGKCGKEGKVTQSEIQIEVNQIIDIIVGKGGQPKPIEKVNYTISSSSSSYNYYAKGNNSGEDTIITINDKTYTATGGVGGTTYNCILEETNEIYGRKNNLYPQYGYGGDGGWIPDTSGRHSNTGYPGGNGYCRITLLAR